MKREREKFTRRGTAGVGERESKRKKVKNGEKKNKRKQRQGKI